MSKKIADLCGDVTDAIEEDKLELATTTALRLRPLATELDNGTPGGVYAKVVELLIEALVSNDPPTAQLARKALLMKLCGAGCSSADPDGPPPPPN